MTELELCKKMYIHATFNSKKTENKKLSEIKALLAEFFDEELIECAMKELRGEPIIVECDPMSVDENKYPDPFGSLDIVKTRETYENDKTINHQINQLELNKKVTNPIISDMARIDLINRFKKEIAIIEAKIHDAKWKLEEEYANPEDRFVPSIKQKGRMLNLRREIYDLSNLRLKLSNTISALEKEDNETNNSK